MKATEALTNGVLQMQLELIRGGPGVVSFMVVNDLFAYSKGIYVPSATAAQVGGHAVSLVGWGVENGVPYWICQNSWGAGWGENGFFRIGRGSDVATIAAWPSSSPGTQRLPQRQLRQLPQYYAQGLHLSV